MKKKEIAINKGHRMALASMISGFTIRTNKEHAAMALRKAKKRERQKNKQSIDTNMSPKSF